MISSFSESSLLRLICIYIFLEVVIFVYIFSVVKVQLCMNFKLKYMEVEFFNELIPYFKM